MIKKQIEKVANFVDSWLSAKDWRTLDDFENVSRLCYEVENKFSLPFSLYGLENCPDGGDAFIQASFFSDRLGHSVIIDHDWYTEFENAQAFADEIERTWQEYERVKGLLAQIKKN